MAKSLLFSFLLLYWSPAWAQTPVAIGEGEAFLGNTGIGRLGSSAAGYYNPAALAAVETDKVAASGSLFQFSSLDVDGTVQTSSDNFDSIPIHVAGVRRRGDLRFAFSIFTLESYDYMVGALVGSVSPVSVKATGTLLALGPSAAMPVNENTFMGLSLLVMKSTMYTGTVTRFDGAGTGGTLHLLAQDESRVSAYTLLPIWGVSYIVNDDFVIGGRWIAPSVDLGGSEEGMSQAVGYVDTGGVPIDASRPQTRTKKDSRFLQPMQLGAGVSINLPANFKLYADANYSFKMDYEQTDGAAETTYKEGMSVSAGFEYGADPSKWALGVFYMPNKGRGDSGEIDHFVGVTGGYLMSEEHIDTGVGLSYVVGAGDSGGISTKSSSLGFLITTSYKF